MKFNFAAPAPAPAPDDVIEEEEWEDVEEHSAEDILKDALPWAIAILFHVALLLIALLVVYTTATVEEEVRLPVSSTISDKPDPPLPPVIVETTDPTEEPAPFSPNPAPSPMPSPVVVSAAPATVGATFAAGMPGGSSSDGNGTSDKGFFGGGGGGVLADTVYVIDATGSLVDTLPHVKKELRKQLNNMNSDTKFNIVFYFGGEYNNDVKGVQNGIGSFATTMVEGSPANIMNAIAWLDQIEPGGTSSPMAAIDHAFEMNPGLMVILSDNITGEGQWQVDRRDLITAVADGAQAVYDRTGGEINMVMQCVQFIHRDPLEQYGETPTLQEMANTVNMGGEGSDDMYLFVSRSDLGLR